VQGGLIERARPTATQRWDGDGHAALVRTIVAQQISTAAARAIHGRLMARFGGRSPTPEEVLAADPDELRAACGLSRAKVCAMRSLAERLLGGELALERLAALGDEDVIRELTAVRGLGVWSAQMFLMLHLRRGDVLPVGDLGIRRAVAIAYGLGQLPSPAQLEAIARPWRPHRTLACLFLWDLVDGAPA